MGSFPIVPGIAAWTPIGVNHRGMQGHRENIFEIEKMGYVFRRRENNQQFTIRIVINLLILDLRCTLCGPKKGMGKTRVFIIIRLVGNICLSRCKIKTEKEESKTGKN